MNPRTRTEALDAHDPGAHAPGCDGGPWVTQARIIQTGPLVSVCQGCGAVRVIRRAPRRVTRTGDRASHE